MKESLEFYDVKTKSKISSSQWRIVKKERDDGRVTYFAVTKYPGEDREVWKIVAKDFALANM